MLALWDCEYFELKHLLPDAYCHFQKEANVLDRSVEHWAWGKKNPLLAAVGCLTWIGPDAAVLCPHLRLGLCYSSLGLKYL